MFAMGMTTHQTGDDAASEGTVTVTETGTGTYTQRITAGHHELAADEPQPIGDDAPEITARFSDPFGNVLGLYQNP